MKNKKYLIIAGLLMIGLLSACVVPTATTESGATRSMNVSGTGRVSVVPDIATVSVGVRTEADEVSAALAGNTESANAIASALEDLGVAREDIQTSNFNVYPSDRYDPMTGEITGRYFAVENTVMVIVRDLPSLGDVLSTVVGVGANSIYGISFDVADREAAVAEARQLAIQDAKEKAEKIAADAGVTLGDLINITVTSGSLPITYYDSMGGAYAESSVPIAAGTLSIIMECNLTFEIK
ncbi:MAG: SIMPL domain-containing protein [Brevefilum sp.]|jgi:uncharacterized protein YggE